MIEVRYDKIANAASIRLVDFQPDSFGFTYPCDPIDVGGMINLDFNKEGCLLKVEVLAARSDLLPSVLRHSTRIDKRSREVEVEGFNADDVGKAAVNVEYDEVADVAYVRIGESIQSGSFGYRYVCDPAGVKGKISLDFDVERHLVGVEVKEAVSKMVPSVLQDSKRVKGGHPFGPINGRDLEF